MITIDIGEWDLYDGAVHRDNHVGTIRWFNDRAEFKATEYAEGLSVEEQKHICVLTDQYRELRELLADAEKEKT